MSLIREGEHKFWRIEDRFDIQILKCSKKNYHDQHLEFSIFHNLEILNFTAILASLWFWFHKLTYTHTRSGHQVQEKSHTLHRKHEIQVRKDIMTHSQKLQNRKFWESVMMFLRAFELCVITSGPDVHCACAYKSIYETIIIRMPQSK